MDAQRLDAIARRAIIRVGDGRGFVLATTREAPACRGFHGQILPASRWVEPVIVTAAHCLPHMPEAGAIISGHERTYGNLLGAIGDAEPSVWAECLFADPVADVAVLGSPDGQELWDQAAAYDTLIEDATPLRFAEAPKGRSQAWLFTLAGGWARCAVEHPGTLWIKQAERPIEGGMSGSPILNDQGAAIGVVCSGEGIEGVTECTSGGPNPALANCLPGWLLQRLIKPRPSRRGLYSNTRL